MKRFYPITCGIILLLFFISTDVSAQWRWLHPVPQGNALNSSSFIDQQNGWFGGEGGVLLKTSDAGTTWTKKYTGYIENVAGVYFSDSQNGIVAQGTRILKTNNGGNTFTQVFRFADLNAEHLFFLNADTGWVSGTFSGINRIAYSTDGGLSWNLQAPSIAEHVNDITALTGGYVYAAADNGNIYRSTDYGANYFLVPVAGASAFNGISFVSNQHGYVCGNAGTLYETTNAGVNWTPITNPASSSSISFHDIISPAPSVLLVAGTDGFVIKSIDNGLNWTVNGQPGWFSGNTYALAGADVFLAGSNGEILKSTDQGDNWNSMITRVSDVNMQGIDAVNINTIFACGEGGIILSSTNGGSSFTSLPPTGSDNFYSISMSSATTGIAVADAGHIYRTTDGINFNTVTSPATNRLTDISRRGNTIYVSGDNETVVKSTDNGITWNIIPTPLTGLGFNYLGLHFLNADTGWIATDQTEILITQDAGVNWNIVSINTNGPIKSIWFTTATRGWICTENGEILKSTDGGLTWNNSYTASTPLHKIVFTDNQNGWAFGDGIILRTANGGNDWNIEFNPSSQALYDAVFLNGSDAFAAGAGTATVLGRNGDLQVNVSTTSFCTDNTYNVAVNTTGTFGTGNQFRVELSDENGDFGYPLTVGSAYATGNTVIFVTIPNGLTDASGYRMRAVSNNPPSFSPVNGTPLTVITSPDAYAIASGPTAFCQGDSLIIYALTSPSWYYQWYKDGILIPGATTDFITVYSTGDYSVEVTDSVCTLTSPVVDVLVSVCNAIHEISESPLKLYPNPASDIVNVSWPASIRIESLSLVDMTGRVLVTMKSLSQHAEIDLSKIPSGMYLLQANGSSVITSRLIRL